MRRSTQHKIDTEDKSYAMRRLEHMRNRAVATYDQEEAGHADELVRIIQNIPAIYFRGFGDFGGPSK